MKYARFKSTLKYKLFRWEQRLKHNRKLYTLLIRLRGNFIRWKRKLIILPFAIVIFTGIFFMFSKPTNAAWYSSSWKFRKLITIQQSMVSGSSNLTNFPILVKVSLPELKANAQSDGDDIMFTSGDGTTQLDHEIESYSSGELMAWVEVPTLDYDDNTPIYMYYGNPTVANQQDVAGTWNSNYIAVWHLNDTVTDNQTSGTHVDATSPAENLTQNNNGSTPGIIAKGQIFDGSSDWMTMADDADLDFGDTADFTISGWVNVNAMVNDNTLVAKKNGTGSQVGYQLRINDTLENGKIRMDMGDGVDGYNKESTTVITPNTGWTHIVGVWDQDSAANSEIYVNGVDDNAASSGTIGNIGDMSNALAFRLGAESDDNNEFEGTMDEVRIANAAMSAGWIATEYNTQAFPSTFISLSAQESGHEPILHWAFDEGTGTTAYDSSTHSNNGTFGGSLTGSSAGPNKIDDAGDPGTLPGAGRQVVRNSSGTLYSVINDGGSCEVWSSSDGSSWTEQDSANNPNCGVSNGAISVAIDGADDLHIAYELNGGSQTNIGYVNFDTGTNTFGTPETGANTSFGFNARYISITADSNNIPHFVYLDTDVTSTHRVEYTNRVGGSWKTPVLIESVNAFTPQIAINEDNIPEVVYANTTNNQTTAAVGNVNNAASFTLHDVDSSATTNTTVAGTSLGIDTSGNTWVAYVDENGATDFVTIIKHNDADGWTTWQSALTNSNGGTEPSLAINGTEVYVFYQDDASDSRIAYDKYTGSWAGETIVHTPGAGVDFRDIRAKWSYHHNNQGSSQIDYLYSDGTDVYWATLGLSSSISSPTIQPENQCVSGKCLSFSTAAVTKTYANDTDLDPGSGSFSIASWFKHSSTAPSGGTVDILIARADGINGVGYKVYMNSSGQMCLGIDDTAGSFPLDSTCSTASYADSKWHYVEGVKSGTTSLTIYVDGLAVGTPDTSITGSAISGTASTLRVGIDIDGSSSPWEGFIDEVKYFDHARTAAQVKTDYAAIASSDNASAVLGRASTDPLNKGLVGYWPLDENTGTTTSDKSGNGLTGTLTNSPTWGTGRFGSGIVLGNSTNQVNVGDQSLLELTTFTIDAWFYRTGTCGAFTYCDIVTKGSSSNTGYALAVDDASGSYKPMLVIRDFTQVTGTTTINTNTWYHITATSDGTTARLYVNGILEATATQTQTPQYSTETFKIGNGNDASDLPAQGTVDEVRVYNRALSSAEVLSLSEWAPMPVGHWKFDERNGTTANDTSGNGNTCSFTSMPTQPWTSGKYGGALNFEKTDDLLNCGSASVLDTMPTMTVSAWIYPRTNTDWIMIANKSDNGNPDTGWLFESSTTNRTLELWVSTTGTQLKRVSANDVYQFNTWSHVAFTWDGSLTATNVHIYVNGVEVPSYTTSQNGTGSRDSDDAQSFVIGNDNFDFVNDMDGYIDDMRVYNYIRSNKQIISDMNAGHPAVGTPVSSAVGHWSLDEGYGTTANDKSPNSNSLSSGGIISTMWTNNGKYGKAWNGFGTNWLSRADDADFDFGSSQDFTISTWIKSDGSVNPSTAEYIVSKETSSAGYALWFTTDGEIICGIDDDATSFPEDSAGDTASNIDRYDGLWHHVVCVRDTSSGRLSLYIDGRLFDADTTLSATGDLSNSDSLTFASRDATNNTDDFQGDIDETKIYRSALNADEVKIEYNQGKTQTLGALSTTDDGKTASNSAARAYCPPGNTETNCAAGADPSPVGEWKLDERSGTTANDTSEYGRTGTLTGTKAQPWSPGKNGSGVNLDNSSDYISVADNDAFSVNTTNKLSVMGWVKFDTLSATAEPFNKGDGSNYEWAIRVFSDGSVRALLFTSAGGNYLTTTQSAAGVVSAGTWNHYAITVDTTAPLLNFYINGRLIASSASTAGSYTNGTATVRFGLRQDNANGTDGTIDDVRIYNYARSQAQIAWDYNRGGPVGWWKFDECTGTTAYDASGNSNNGTITIGGSGTYTSAGTCGSNTAAESWNSGGSGKFNAALALDGTNDHSVVNASSNFNITTDITISGWIKRGTTNSSMTAESILVKTNNTSWDYEFGIDYDFGTNDALFFYGDGLSPTYTYSTGTITDTTTWHHVVVTRANGTVTFYIDGKPSGSSSQTNSFNANSVPLNIGSCGTTCNQNYLNGLLDDVRIYNYSLTSSQIKLLYNEGAAVRFGPQTGLPQ